MVRQTEKNVNMPWLFVYREQDNIIACGEKNRGRNESMQGRVSIAHV